MKSTAIFVLLAGVLFAGCDGGSSPSNTGGSGAAPSSGSPLTAPADYVGAAAKAKKSADKTLAAAGVIQAIQRFEAEEGRLPKTLGELVPKYLSAVPAPPAGMKYAYNPADGSLKVVQQ